MAMSIFGLIIVVFGLLALSMLVVGIVLIFKSRRRVSDFPTCGGCGYDLTGSTAATDLCPECGGQFTVVGINSPKSERRTGLLVIGIILLILPLTCGGLLTLGIAAPLAASKQASQQSFIAQQQQVALQALNDQQKLLTEQLTSLNTQLAEMTDEVAQGELEEVILKLQKELEDLNAEIEQLVDEQGDAGD